VLHGSYEVLQGYKYLGISLMHHFIVAGLLACQSIKAGIQSKDGRAVTVGGPDGGI